MAELKTRKNNASVQQFLQQISDPAMRQDCVAVTELMRTLTKSEPVMWGTAIVGFGHYHYKYASGREGDWFRCGFSPRKQALTLYLMGGMKKELLQKLGRHKTGKSCLYIKRLSDVNINVLKTLIRNSSRHPMGQQSG